MHTIKPLDTELIDELLENARELSRQKIIPAIGGLGSAVSEHVSYTGGVPIRMVGVTDRFPSGKVASRES